MSAKDTPATASFKSTLSVLGNNTGIDVPEAIIETLGSGKRPPVLVEINGYEYQNTVGVMGGKYLISVSAAVRKATGLKGGDPIDVTLTVSEKPRVVEIPADFQEALNANKAALNFFMTLSNSLQRYHVDNVSSAKSPETRRRRIDKSISLFLEGKQR